MIALFDKRARALPGCHEKGAGQSQERHRGVGPPVRIVRPSCVRSGGGDACRSIGSVTESAAGCHGQLACPCLCIALCVHALADEPPLAPTKTVGRCRQNCDGPPFNGPHDGELSDRRQCVILAGRAASSVVAARAGHTTCYACRSHGKEPYVEPRPLGLDFSLEQCRHANEPTQ